MQLVTPGGSGTGRRSPTCRQGHQPRQSCKAIADPLPSSRRCPLGVPVCWHPGVGTEACMAPHGCWVAPGSVPGLQPLGRGRARSPAAQAAAQPAALRRLPGRFPFCLLYCPDLLPCHRLRLGRISGAQRAGFGEQSPARFRHLIQFVLPRLKYEMVASHTFKGGRGRPAEI